jgi:hypothetical protein
MDKTLVEIEREYSTEVIKFFTREYSTVARKRDREEIIRLISKQIVNRLLNTGLVSDYKVEVILFLKDERRDIVIDNILEDKDADITSRVTVYIKYRDGHMMCYEHLII